MSVESTAHSLRSLVPPRVNASSSEAKLDFGGTELIVYGAATAGQSSSVHVPAGAMELYADSTGFLSGHATTSGERTLTGHLGIWQMFGSPRSEQPKSGAVINVVMGPEGLIAYPAQVPPTLWLANPTPLRELAVARQYASQSRLSALRDIQRQLDKEKASFAQRSPADVIRQLTDDLGMSQLVIARAIGVSPTAVRKWRRGEVARPEHRDTLTLLAAFARVLEQHVHDPAGWIEIPISSQSTITPLDLFVARSLDLAVLFAAGLSDSTETLGALRPGWREQFAPDRDYDVIQLRDGSRTAVPRREADR